MKLTEKFKEFVKTPWFKSEVNLRGKSLVLSPSVDDVQQAIDDAAVIIVSASKRISQWQFMVRIRINILCFIFASKLKSHYVCIKLVKSQKY